MPITELYVLLDDERLTALAIMSEATGRTVEEIVQAAVSEFLEKASAR